MLSWWRVVLRTSAAMCMHVPALHCAHGYADSINDHVFVTHGDW